VSGRVDLRAGQPVSIQLDYSSATAWVIEELGLGGNVRLGWQPPDTQIQDAARLAADSDVAVVFASHALGEGMDRRSLGLPGDQDALISAVAAANPRTVVVLNTGAPVLMPWLDEVSAVVQAWYAGQRFGEAIAAVLFGDADPGGRLPLTFPATPDQGPITRVEQYPGVGGDTRYDEGILVGYRWYDQTGQQPLFPFGHGLSYGDFRYGAPRLDLDERTGSVTVSVELTNICDRPASDVAQLYVAAPAAAGEPPRQLRGFAKVRLVSGASTTVTFQLTVDDLAAFDEASGRWVVHDGRYDVLVGRSSRDVQGDAVLEVREGKLLQVQGSHLDLKK
jgi:beta-glucosidase